jgi:hypothetical protein
MRRASVPTVNKVISFKVVHSGTMRMGEELLAAWRTVCLCLSVHPCLT